MGEEEELQDRLSEIEWGATGSIVIGAFWVFMSVYSYSLAGVGEVRLEPLASVSIMLGMGGLVFIVLGVVLRYSISKVRKFIGRGVHQKVER